MRSRLQKLALCGALAGAAALARPAHRSPAPEQGEPRIVPPIAAPSVTPGVGRCTSDGACTVTDASGTRRAARVFLAE